ncbi:MAG: acetoacetate decarboxylase family protein [Desulfobacteraceae bacterium]
MWFFSIVILICLTFYLIVRKQFKSYRKKGMWRNFHGIFTILEPINLKLYRRLLPAQLDMPEIPLVSMFIIDYVTVKPFPLKPYLEGSVAIKCKCNGEDGWHVLTMPVNTNFACLVGRRVGYPHYVADKITLENNDQGIVGKVHRKGKEYFSLYYTSQKNEETESDLTSITQNNLELLKEPRFLLVPQAKGPVLKRVIIKEKIPAKWNTRQGQVKIQISSREPWTGLLTNGTASVGYFKKFTGGNIVLNKKVN